MKKGNRNKINASGVCLCTKGWMGNYFPEMNNRISEEMIIVTRSLTTRGGEYLLERALKIPKKGKN